MVRDDDRELVAHDNVCIHRGAPLARRVWARCSDHVPVPCVVVPPRRWVDRRAVHEQGSVGSDGAPFRPGDHRLVPIRLEVWEGFVFATHDPATPPLAPRLAGLTDVVAPFRMADYVPVHQQVDVWATNWKLLVENFMDAYHVFKVHAATFGKDGDSTLDTVMHPGTDDWAHHVVLPDTGGDLAHPRQPSAHGRVGAERSCSPRCSPRR